MIIYQIGAQRANHRRAFLYRYDYYHNCNVICLPKKLLGARQLFKTCSCAPDLTGIWKCWFLRRGENRSTRRKTSRSKDENCRTRATLVGGERSHHCAIPAPRGAGWTIIGLHVVQFEIFLESGQFR